MTSPSIPSTMRAQQWTSVNTTLSKALRLNTSAPTPSSTSLKPNQVLVHVHYSSLNPVDYKMPELPVIGRFAISKPASPCSDFSGTVVAVGSGRSDLKPGQLVLGTLPVPGGGACAEYIVVTGKDGCAVLPEGVKPEQGGCVGIAGATAYQSIIPMLPAKSFSGGKPHVFVNGGSGGCGVFAIQIAKAKGCRVVVTCSGRNADFCRQLGADAVIDYTKQDIVKSLVSEAQSHGAFDLAIDNVGSIGSLYWAAHEYLAPAAKYVAVGATPSLGLMAEFAKIFLWPAVFGGGKRQFTFMMASPKAEHFTAIAEMMKKGELEVPIEEVYALEDVPRAFERLYTGRVRGKLVIKVSE